MVGGNWGFDICIEFFLLLLQLEISPLSFLMKFLAIFLDLFLGLLGAYSIYLKKFLAEKDP